MATKKTAPSKQNSGLSALQIILIGLVLAAAAAGGVWGYRTFKPGAEQWVAQIGEYAVTPKQLALRQAHANIYYPGSGTPQVALAQLVQGYLAAELMKQQGVTLDRTTWLAEDERINKQTRDPATLAKIKFIYGEDSENYLYIGILPDFAQSRIYKLYRSSPAFAEQARIEASSFLDEADKKPAEFAALAAKRSVQVRRLMVNAKTGMQPITDKPAAGEPGGMKDASPKSEQEMRLRAEMDARAGQQDLEAARSLLGKLAGLTDGQVYRNTLESPESFETVRLVKHNADGTAVVEMAGFAKPDFGKWFWIEAGKIPVRVRDADLKTRFVSEVGWAKQLNIQ